MNYLIFLLLIGFSIIFVVLGLVILTPRYNKEFREDKLIKSDDKTFALFELDSKYHEFLSTYKIFKHGSRRFLTLNKNESINYIEYNVVCFKKEKFLQSIRVKDTNIRKNEEYLVNLPTNATSFKVEIIQINDTLFEVNDMKKVPIFKEILASLFFSLGSIAPISLIDYIIFKEFKTIYYKEDRVLSFMFNKPAIYISIAVFAVLVFIISFLILFFKNKRKTFKFINNKKVKEIDKDINDLFKFKWKIKKDNYTNSVYYKVNSYFPKNFINGIVTVNVYNHDNTLVISFNKYFSNKDRNFNIKQDLDYAFLDFNVIEANFESYYYKNNEFNNFEYINKDIVKAGKLTTNGVLSSLIVFFLVFAISCGGVLTSYSSLKPFENPNSYFGYDYLDNDNKDKGIEISDYYSTNKMMITPKTVDGYSVQKIKSEAFKDSHNIYKAGFDSNLEIGVSAFESSSLFEVDLTNVKKIGASAFKSTHLVNLTIPSSVNSISNEAFRNIRTLTSLTFEEGSTTLNLSAYSFRYIRVWGDIVIKRDISSLSGVFMNATFNECYIYSTIYGVTKSTYKTYFNNNNSVYFINSRHCNHDFNSFYLENDSIHKEFNGELISKQNGTCTEKETFNYKCTVCGESFQLHGSIDPNNHHYVDGICEWCGKEEVKN